LLMFNNQNRPRGLPGDSTALAFLLLCSPRCVPMFPNSYGSLDAFVGLLRLFFALLTLGFGVAALWNYRTARLAGGETGREGQLHLLILLAFLLLGLNFASWPLFYLLLQSFVREMPGVMCIYGVTRFGSGSIGPARFLPGLILALQITKPTLVF